MAHTLRPPFSAKDHFQGDIDAPLELVEYGDYQCPHCGRAYPIIKYIQSKLGKELKFVFRNFPLSESHPQAFAAAVAAEAADRQGGFWKMHDYIYEYQSRLPLSPFEAFAKALGLDSQRLIHDMQDPALSTKVDADFDSGLHSGVNGTPTFFINGKRYDDNWDEDSLFQNDICSTISGVLDPTPITCNRTSKKYFMISELLVDFCKERRVSLPHPSG